MGMKAMRQPPKRPGEGAFCLSRPVILGDVRFITGLGNSGDQRLGRTGGGDGRLSVARLTVASVTPGTFQDLFDAVDAGRASHAVDLQYDVFRCGVSHDRFLSMRGAVGMRSLYRVCEVIMWRFQVDGMSCGHCEKAVRSAVQALQADAVVQVDLASGKVSVQAPS